MMRWEEMLVGAGARGRMAGPCRWRASEGLLDLCKDGGRCIRNYNNREGRIRTYRLAHTRNTSAAVIAWSIGRRRVGDDSE